MAPLLLAATLAATLLQAAGPPAATLDGRPADPFAPAAPAVALIFMDAECPVANRAVPEINRVFDAFAGRGVRLYLVYPDGPADMVRRHVTEFALAPPVLRDPARRLVERAGATVTPEAAVFDTAGRLMYRGRIDDRQVAFGRTRPVATRHDLAEALDALLAGTLDAPRFTNAIGCYIHPPS